MNDASLTLEARESITLHAYTTALQVHVWFDDKEILHLSCGNGNRDIIQMEFFENKLRAIKSMTLAAEELTACIERKWKPGEPCDPNDEGDTK